MDKKLPFLEAIAILVGTIIGAGILGIPYVVAQAGFLTGVAVLAVLAAAVILINLFIGEIVLSTKNRYQLTGYANKYLGKAGKYLMFGATVFGFYGALLAYLIGEGEVLAALTGGNPLLYSLLFFVFGSLLIYLGLAIIKKFEFFMTLIILLIVLVISLWSFDVINFENLAEFNLAKLFIPYGVILFAIGGSSAVPQLRFVLQGREKLVKRAILIGVAIPFIVYLLFTLVVVGVTGLTTTEVATIGLGNLAGKSMIIFGNLFAFFTMGTSFLTLGLALKDTYRFDLNLSYKFSWLLACLPPLIIFILGLNSFVKVLGTVGAIGGGIEGLLILAIYLKLKSLKKTEREPEYKIPVPGFIIGILSLIFIGGIVYTLRQFS
ncbi:GerAB/ArcD/ProY family transporter [Patescibacteria group bacterium]|nr:GerAB/ArcD/ProY family transporter [Patescibacteria group bacterium]